jgi:hypothetical protein
MINEQKKVYRIDGQVYQLRATDKDNDGEADFDQPEMLEDQGIQPIQQPTETGETIRELNEDKLDKKTRMSSIDMRSRLHPFQISSMTTFDSLISMKFLPRDCSAITRQIKRLSVSIEGKGRQEIVQITGGLKEHEEKKGMGGMLGGIKDWLGGRKA